MKHRYKFIWFFFTEATRAKVKMDMSGMTIKLESSDIMYLQKDIWTNYQDVFIKSIQGKVYGFNRLMLASLSWLCKELFLQVSFKKIRLRPRGAGPGIAWQNLCPASVLTGLFKEFAFL